MSRYADPPFVRSDDLEPIVEIAKAWGVLGAQRFEVRQPFQTWRGRASAWTGRLGDGQTVLIEVQDTWAEPWIEYGGPLDVVDLREAAESLVDEVRQVSSLGLHPSLVPWLQVRHDPRRAVLLWMRATVATEGSALPTDTADPRILLARLRDVAEAVDWAARRCSFGIGLGHDNLVWSKTGTFITGWGKEAFERLLNYHNAEVRLGACPELFAGLRAGRLPLAGLRYLGSPRADVSVPSFLFHWLTLRLGKREIWFEEELDVLPAKERECAKRWLKNGAAVGEARDFLNEMAEVIS